MKAATTSPETRKQPEYIKTDAEECKGTEHWILLQEQRTFTCGTTIHRIRVQCEAYMHFFSQHTVTTFGHSSHCEQETNQESTCCCARPHVSCCVRWSRTGASCQLLELPNSNVVQVHTSVRDIYQLLHMSTPHALSRDVPMYTQIILTKRQSTCPSDVILRTVANIQASQNICR
jgi:hypothetical protein